MTHMPESVGIRELRQHLSRYVARTVRGESFEVTDRGRPVGRLVPPTTGEPWLDALVATGTVRPATHRSSRFPAPATSGSGSISAALEETRSERLP
jgi:prevent-host-death family protein